MLTFPFVANYSDFGKEHTPEAFEYCSIRGWKAHCEPWHADSQLKFRKKLMELDDIYGNIMRERYPQAGRV